MEDTENDPEKIKDLRIIGSSYKHILLFRVIGLRWFVYQYRWYPAFLICKLLGHNDLFWYDGEWCGRCGGRVE